METTNAFDLAFHERKLLWLDLLEEEKGIQKHFMNCISVVTSISVLAVLSTIIYIYI